ncbi:M64 family metallopeptidase [Hoylesella shahii]|uniref:M64 family metallopeptidase n=1 Tax=Hoylesella shahii TaxID=228603 RepID=UPI000B2DE212|nr:M64 family metallopeptidase [Hoylesella shahii]
MRFNCKYLTYTLLTAFALTIAACNERVDDEEQAALTRNTDDIVALDGKVTTLQTATKGNGYNIILMGDGFTVDMIKNGTYDEVMKKSAEHLFSLEPMKSLRPYFNVYVVQKVSLSSDLNGATALGSAISSANKVCGFVNDDNLDYKTMLYASTVPGYKEENSVISVVMNTTKSGGITYWHDWNSTLACAYTTLYGGVDGNYFRYTLIHETAGHAIGKLDDEYDLQNLAIDAEGLERYRYGHTLGWLTNISTTTDPTKAPWAQFLADPRYANQA